MPGFESLHQLLSPRYRMGLVTSSPDTIVNMMDEMLNLRALFPRILTGDMTAHNKPHPEPYQTMMTQMGLEPGAVAVVEDSIPGLQSAWDSGAWTIALTGSVAEAERPRRHATVHHLSDISIELLSSLTHKFSRVGT